jgi:hypothetical protein
VFDLFTHPDSRVDEIFRLSKFSYENHADYNATKNIDLGIFIATKPGTTKAHPWACT